MKTVTYAAIGVLGVFVAGAEAGLTVPDGFDLSVEFGGNTWNISDNPEAIQDIIPTEDGIQVIGAWSVSGMWAADWTITLEGTMADDDEASRGSGRGVGFAFVSNSFNLTNMSGSAQDFVVSISQMDMPINPTSISGSNSGNTGDGDGVGGSTLQTSTGLPFYEALIDGTPVRTLFDDPTTVTAPQGQTNSYGPGNFSNEASIALTTSIGIRNYFNLTPGDNAGMTSTFLVVPTPGAGALLAIAGLGVIRRRR